MTGKERRAEFKLEYSSLCPIPPAPTVSVKHLHSGEKMGTQIDYITPGLSGLFPINKLPMSAVLLC